VVYYRNSLVITCFLLIESIVVKAISNLEQPIFEWVNKTFSIIRNKQFDFMFFSSKSDENNDENILIDENTKPDENTNNKKMWLNFGSFLDKLSLLIVTVLYVLMFFLLIPTKYARDLEKIQMG
jgi:hypothetical protein